MINFFKLLIKKFLLSLSTLLRIMFNPILNRFSKVASFVLNLLMSYATRLVNYMSSQRARLAKLAKHPLVRKIRRNYFMLQRTLMSILSILTLPGLLVLALLEYCYLRIYEYLNQFFFFQKIFFYKRMYVFKVKTNWKSILKNFLQVTLFQYLRWLKRRLTLFYNSFVEVGLWFGLLLCFLELVSVFHHGSGESNANTFYEILVSEAFAAYCPGLIVRTGLYMLCIVTLFLVRLHVFRKKEKSTNIRHIARIVVLSCFYILSTLLAFVAVFLIILFILDFFNLFVFKDLHDTVVFSFFDGSIIVKKNFWWRGQLSREAYYYILQQVGSDSEAIYFIPVDPIVEKSQNSLTKMKELLDLHLNLYFQFVEKYRKLAWDEVLWNTLNNVFGGVNRGILECLMLIYVKTFLADDGSDFFLPIPYFDPYFPYQILDYYYLFF